MGKKKKSFIDKKNSATFMLLARDTSTFPESAAAPVPPASDRVFVRVDNNHFGVRSVFEEDDGVNDHASYQTAGLRVGDDVSSIFADAPGDTDDEGSFSQSWPSHAVCRSSNRPSSLLSDEVRQEILELGLPDDGYNYLQHLREISNAGAGSAYYQNSKARLDLVPIDVKAFDASRLKVSGVESNKNSIYAVASKAVGVKVQKVVDPDVARLLDDSDLSRFGSDTEDFEEDFVFKANIHEGNEGESEEVEEAEPGTDKAESKMCSTNAEQEDESLDEDSEDELNDGEKPRIHRLLDEQFDLLTLREYGDTYSDDNGYLDEEGDAIDAKLHDALKECKVDDLEFEEQYRVPGDYYVHKHEAPGMGIQLDDSTDVISRCREYAEKYYNEDEDKGELIVVEESSDESEVWDCETIVSTYSNLDNHPGTIQTPEILKKKFAKTLSVDSIKKTGMIELRGKEKLPVEFLPHVTKEFEKVKKPAGFEKQKSKPRREESKDEKKERKVAVKEERRESRRTKKELKGLYRCETHKAQKVAAVSMPSSIHLM